MKKIVRDERGSLLVAVLVTGMILIMLSTALAALSFSEIKDTVASQEQTQAYYIAKSGVEVAVQNLETDKENLDFNVSGSIGEGTFEANATRQGNEIIIQSTGRINAQKETVTHFVEIEQDTSSNLEFDDVAIYAAERMELKNAAQVTGDVIINTTNPNNISLINSAQIKGNLFIGPGGDIDNFSKRVGNSLQGYIDTITTPKIYPAPIVPSFPEGLDNKGDYILTNSHSDTISQDGFYNQITITNSSRLTIDVGSGERIIRTKNFTITNTGDIKIKGSGKLKLYISESFKVGNTSRINQNGDPEQVVIYYDGSKKFKPTNSSTLVATLYSGSADLDFSNSSIFQGNIISGGSNISLKNSSTVDSIFVYAPLATIKLNNAGVLMGRIVCKEITLTNSARVVFNPSTIDLVPIETGAEGSGEIKFKRGIWK